MNYNWNFEIINHIIPLYIRLRYCKLPADCSNIESWSQVTDNIKTIDISMNEHLRFREQESFRQQMNRIYLKTIIL